MASKNLKQEKRMNIVINLEGSDQHKVCYSLDDRFCAVYPVGEQWRIMLSTSVSRKIAEAVKLQHKLEKEPVILFQARLGEQMSLEAPGKIMQ